MYQRIKDKLKSFKELLDSKDINIDTQCVIVIDQHQDTVYLFCACETGTAIMYMDIKDTNYNLDQEDIKILNYIDIIKTGMELKEVKTIDELISYIIKLKHLETIYLDFKNLLLNLK